MEDSVMIAGRRNSRRDGEIMDNGVIKTIELDLGEVFGDSG